jgi:TolB-like protein/Tfp pilus assembly protein PilF
MLTKEGTTLGTVAYMSPEQAQGAKVDHRADVWALGAVIYEMVTGRQPFLGDYEQAVIYSIMNEDPDPPTALRTGVPMELERIILKTLAKEPCERYQHVEEMLVDLKNLRKSQEMGISKTAKPSGTRPGLMTESEQPKPSIAVLPFVNMSADPENEYFSEGLCEEIINALTKIKDLKVTARTSSFSFKSKDADIQEIGQKLKVENVLEGSVRQAGDRLRITAQLVKARDGYHLWSERYDRVMDDVFAIQDEITLAIVDRLKIELMGEEKQAIVAHHSSNLEAYQLYLKGRYYRYTKNNVNGALPYFQRAVALDPSHVLSRVGLAEIYVLQYFYGFTRPHDAYGRACIELDAAFKIQPDSPEVLAVDAFNRLCHDRDWSQVEQQLRRAIELNPVNVHSHAWYGILLTILGRHDEAKAAIEKAQELDPLSPYPYAMTGLVFLNGGKVDRAVAAFEKALKIDSENMLGLWGLGAALVALGRRDAAIETLERVVDRSGRSMFFLGLLGWALAAAGRTGAAQKISAEFSARSGQEYGTMVGIAWLLAELGEVERAWEILWKAEEERQPLALFLGLPGFDRLRADRRFGKLKERMHLST